ncbi:nitroreductase [Paenibacillus yanchengensis]|uniref:Putative NAD(P)H nitroreductase n=1 Tax=Paenibacillus yanchengensis TaxID=2035833 RepID=A0ABW4YFD5_9BACL
MKQVDDVLERQLTVGEAIRTRRSIGRVKQEEVPREYIENMIEAATWAPCHFNTQPWRFIAMTGDGRKLLGDGYGKVMMAENPQLLGEELAERLQKEEQKAMRAPVVIAAICSPSDDPRALIEEELAATHAAVQNMLLQAHELGLATIWRSGDATYHEAMRSHFQLTDRESIVGFIYVGYSDLPEKVSTRKPVEAVMSWADESK